MIPFSLVSLAGFSILATNISRLLSYYISYLRSLIMILSNNHHFISLCHIPMMTLTSAYEDFEHILH